MCFNCLLSNRPTISLLFSISVFVLLLGNLIFTCNISIEIVILVNILNLQELFFYVVIVIILSLLYSFVKCG